MGVAQVWYRQAARGAGIDRPATSPALTEAALRIMAAVTLRFDPSGFAVDAGWRHPRGPLRVMAYDEPDAGPGIAGPDKKFCVLAEAQMKAPLDAL